MRRALWVVVALCCWAAPARAAVPVYQTTGTYAFNDSGATVALNAPASIANNDILIAEVYQEPASSTAAVITGYTSIVSIAASNFKFTLLYKRAASEAGTYSTTGTGATFISGVVHRISGGITSGSPIDVAGTGDTATSASAAATGVTTASTDVLMVYVVNTFDGLSATAPGTYTERFDTSGQYLATKDITTQGTATGTVTATLSASGVYACVLFGIRSQAPGAGTAPNGMLLQGVADQ